MDYLIQYLEAIEENEDFIKSGHKSINDFAHLLFNCYIMQEKIDKFKYFIKNKSKKNFYNILKIAIDVCLETQNLNLALFIAKQKHMSQEIMEILILKLNKIDEALEYRELSQEYEEENLLDEIHRGYLEILQSERMDINSYSAKKLTLNNNPNKKKR